MYYYLPMNKENSYAVGFYDPDKKFRIESDHKSKESAAARVHYLNGGNTETRSEPTKCMSCGGTGNLITAIGPIQCPDCFGGYKVRG